MRWDPQVNDLPFDRIIPKRKEPGREVVISAELLQAELQRTGSAPRIDPITQSASIDHYRQRRNHVSSAVTDPKKIRQRIHADLARLAEAEALATRFPAEPPIGTVLRFQRQFLAKDVTYQYLAFRAPNGSWYLTGQSLDNMTPNWSELRDLIGNEPCDLAMSWNEIPVNEPEAVDQVTDPAKWWELVWGEKAKEDAPKVIDQQD